MIEQIIGSAIGAAVGVVIILIINEIICWRILPPLWWRKWRSARVKSPYKWRIYR